MQAAAAVLAVHVVVEAFWTLRLMAVVGDDSRALAAAIGAVSTSGLALLAWFVWHGRARTVAGLVEVVFVGGSVDWLLVFPELRAETLLTMAVAAVALVLLAEPRRERD